LKRLVRWKLGHFCRTSAAKTPPLCSKTRKAAPIIVSIMTDLLDAVEYVANHQAQFEADEDICGNFKEKLAQIQRLYAGNEGRYRRYP